MKLTIDRAPLLAALSSIHGVVARRSTVPILTNFLLKAEGGVLHVTATDLDMQATTAIPARIEDGGETTMSADKLYDIARSIPEGAELSIDLPADETRAAVRAGRSRWTVPILPARDFPNMVLDGVREAMDLSASGFARILALGSYCAKTDGTQSYLECAYLHSVDGAARVASADGKQLAYGELLIPGMKASENGAMIPPKMVAAVGKMLGMVGDIETVKVELSEAKAQFTIGATRLVGKLLDAMATKYVDYQRLIPKDYDGELVIDTDLFLGGLKRAMIMAEPKAGFQIQMDIRAGMIALAARNQDQGQAAEEVDADWSGGDHDTAFNGQLMLAHLAQVRTENVVIKVSPKGGPMVLSETGQGDWLALLMPQAR